MIAPGETVRVALIPAEDISAGIVVVALVVVIAGLVLLFFELRRAREARKPRVIATALLASIAVLLAVVRPHRLRAREVQISPRVLVLLDRSRSMALPSNDQQGGTPRIDVAEEAVKKLKAASFGRVDVLAFGATSGVRDANSEGGPLQRADGAGSDLSSALHAVLSKPDDPPAAIVIVSDGRVEAGDLPSRAVGPVIHAVAIGDGSPPDAAIKSVQLAGAAVAHQPLPLRVEVACTGGLSCSELVVTVRELRERGGSTEAILATGTATIKDGSALIELPVTLEHAGTSAIEVALASPNGDAIAENDRRMLTIDVARERVRILHVAGRPSYDVRALRTWLKSDTAIDVVSFFILRTPGDDVNAPDDELALIPFPVKELFTEHLHTFDAILFQDFDAGPYGLTPYLPAIAEYVRKGGGLIHVGGPNSFSAGGYAGTPLADVTPAQIPPLTSVQQAADTTPFVPVTTPAARGAPILAELESIIGDDLPEFPGTSILGDVRAGAMALWTHPKRTTPSGKPMPVLAISDVGHGRSIALGLDSARILAFSGFAAKSGGRAYDALLRGLVGWLMRDPRYEPIRGRLVHASGEGPCLAGAPAAIRIEASPVAGPAHLRTDLSTLDPPRAEGSESLPEKVEANIDGTPPILVPLAGLPPAGSWATRFSIGEQGGQAPSALATRTLSVCERGGEEWADPRPDRAKLQAITKANAGITVDPGSVGSLPRPSASVVSLERNVAPILPTWAWATIAAIALGAHWFVRRRGGLA
ncbi:MAG: hypothetical protein ACXWP4_13015 [Polyangiales bacterium]